MIQINHLYAAIPFELVANNEPAAATGDPTAILYRNGSASGVIVTVVATAVVGLYHCSFTTGSDWDKTDRLYLQASATVGSVSDRKVIWDSFAEPDAVMRGTDGVDATLAKQDEILAAVGAIEPSLTGPFTRTITVTDSVSGNPIEGVSVRLSLASDTESKLTNASGVASFTVSAGTWSYDVFRSGYAGASGTVVVSASGGTAVTLVANATTSASAPLCAVTLPIKDSYGQPIEGAAVFIKFLGFDDAAPPLGLVLSPPPPLTSDASGLISVDLIRLANYSVTYSTTEDVRRIDISVPDAGSYTVAE